MPTAMAAETVFTPPQRADAMRVFDRAQVRLHRDRAARGDWARHGFLADHASAALADRLNDVTRRFDRVIVLGCQGGEIVPHLPVGQGSGWLVQADLSPRFAALARARGRAALAADEELLPFAEGVADLILSPLSLHWVNDLPGALVQCNRSLQPDGLFLGSMLGGDTLFELRRTLLEVEAEMLGGVSPRISPFTEVRDAGGLLQRAGFALPVVDSDTLTVTYEHAFALLAELRGMGESHAGLSRHTAIPPRTFWPAVAARYQALFAEPDGRIPATFQIITLSGWAPAHGQQRPSRPGSATARLADALNTHEVSAGEKAGS